VWWCRTGRAVLSAKKFSPHRRAVAAAPSCGVGAGGEDGIIASCVPPFAERGAVTDENMQASASCVTKENLVGRPLREIRRRHASRPKPVQKHIRRSGSAARAGRRSAAPRARRGGIRSAPNPAHRLVNDGALRRRRAFCAADHRGRAGPGERRASLPGPSSRRPVPARQTGRREHHSVLPGTTADIRADSRVPRHRRRCPRFNLRRRPPTRCSPQCGLPRTR